ncbi:hypothetical protein Y1Q_0020215 [Alligator mississippiensis]|uniref:Uncharacterized protein n=1 Tax=Alligator mississippiensis TaxID=8496 RepID=A0A151PIC3_ALLMI|nr:hypothetical protein Y1Q_0020215 [Alligator mississippiensis]
MIPLHWQVGYNLDLLANPKIMCPIMHMRHGKKCDGPDYLPVIHANIWKDSRSLFDASKIPDASFCRGVAAFQDAFLLSVPFWSESPDCDTLQAPK